MKQKGGVAEYIPFLKAAYCVLRSGPSSRSVNPIYYFRLRNRASGPEIVFVFRGTARAPFREVSMFGHVHAADARTHFSVEMVLLPRRRAQFQALSVETALPPRRCAHCGASG